jgi:hypothetical protein
MLNKHRSRRAQTESSRNTESTGPKRTAAESGLCTVEELEEEQAGNPPEFDELEGESGHSPSNNATEPGSAQVGEGTGQSLLSNPVLKGPAGISVSWVSIEDL